MKNDMVGDVRRYSIDEYEKHRFFQLPEFLFSPEYEDLSNDARVLYALFKSRFALSIKNGWFDEERKIYFIYSREDIAKILGLSVRTASKVVKELSEYGLIDEVRVGHMKANRIYLSYRVESQAQPMIGNNCVSEKMIGNNCVSLSEKVADHDRKDLPASYIDSNYIDFNNNNNKEKEKNEIHESEKIEEKSDIVNQGNENEIDDSYSEIIKRYSLLAKRSGLNLYASELEMVASWVDDFDISLINKALELAECVPEDRMFSPLKYINRVLCDWFSKDIRSVEDLDRLEAEKIKSMMKSKGVKKNRSKTDKNGSKHNIIFKEDGYTQEDMDLIMENYS